MTQPVAVTPTPSAAELEARQRLVALRLIGHAAREEKVCYIASRAPDLLVDHVLDWRVDDVARDGVVPVASTASEAELDRVIARIALGADPSNALPLSA